MHSSEIPSWVWVLMFIAFVVPAVTIFFDTRTWHKNIHE